MLWCFLSHSSFSGISFTWNFTLCGSWTLWRLGTLSAFLPVHSEIVLCWNFFMFHSTLFLTPNIFLQYWKSTNAYAFGFKKNIAIPNYSTVSVVLTIIHPKIIEFILNAHFFYPIVSTDLNDQAQLLIYFPIQMTSGLLTIWNMWSCWMTFDLSRLLSFQKHSSQPQVLNARRTALTEVHLDCLFHVC